MSPRLQRRHAGSIAVAMVLMLSACAPTPVRQPPDPGAATPVAEDAGKTEALPAEADTELPTVDVPEPALPAPPPPPLTIAAVGDIMLGTDFPENRLPDGDASILTGVAALLASADITFGNLEGVLADGGEPEKVCNDPSLCYLFRTPTRYARHLAEAGFDMMSLANNHARDFGEAGRDETMRALSSVGIAHSGREGDIAVVTVDGRDLAMIAFSPNIGSHSINDIDLAAQRVADLSARHDLVLVSFHGGAEGVDALHVGPGEETYYGEARGDVMAFSRAVIEAGADLVIGHGPHVPRGLELYKGRLIAYSLGNFATHYGISVAGIKGLAPILFATLAHDGRFIRGRIFSTRQQRPVGPVPDPDHEAARLMQSLSMEDFGPAAPLFGPEGRIFPAIPEAGPVVFEPPGEGTGRSVPHGF